MSLGEEVVLEPLQAADGLSGETAHFCELTADWSSLGSNTLADGVLDATGQRRLELRGELCEGFYLGPCALERCVDVGLGRAPSVRFLQALSRPRHGCFVHWQAS